MDNQLRHELLEIERHVEEVLYIAIPNKQFKKDILVDYYYYPQDFVNFNEEEQADVDYCLKRAGYADCYDALADFMQKANIALRPKHEFNSENNYTFMVIEVSIVPFLKEMKRLLRIQTVVFICAPYIAADGQQHFKVFLATPTTGNLFLQLKNSRQISAESENAVDQKYWALFEQAVREVYQGIYSAQTEDTEQDEEAYVDRFIELAQITDRDEFKTQWRLIRSAPQQFIEQLKEDGFYGEPNQSFLYYRFLLEDYSYYTDWEMDYDEISDYISEIIGQDFWLDEENGLQLDQIAEKIEQVSDFTLLLIDTQLDGYALFICKKAESEALLELAKRLDFPIESARAF